MIAKLKELVSDTLLYGISTVVSRFLNYLLVPFYTKYFIPEEYGVVGLLYALLIFLNVIFTFGMESAYLRYAKNRQESRSVYRTLQLTLLVCSILLGTMVWGLDTVLLALLGLKPSFAYLIHLLVGILVFDTLSAIPFAELRLVRKSGSFAFLKIINVIVNLGLNFWFVIGLEWGIVAVFVSNIVASAITFIWVNLLTVKQWKGQWNRDLLKKAASFGLPYVPAGLGYAINEVIDRFFLNRLTPNTIKAIYETSWSSEYIVGVYNACYKLSVFMLLLVQMYRMAWQPFFLRHSESKGVGSLFSKIFDLLNMTAAFAVLVLALFVQEIARLPIPFLDSTLINEKYWDGLSIVPILLFAYWFQAWYVHFTSGIFIKEKTIELPKITLFGSIITISANIVLVPFLGMMGAAIATLLSYSAMGLMIYQKSTQVFPVNYRMGTNGSMMGMVAIIVSFPLFIFPELFSIWMKLGLILFGIGGIAGLTFLTPKVKSQVL